MIATWYKLPWEQEVGGLNSPVPAMGDFEAEEIILYPAVAARLAKRELSYVGGYFPGGLPADQI